MTEQRTIPLTGFFGAASTTWLEAEARVETDCRAFFEFGELTPDVFGDQSVGCVVEIHVNDLFHPTTSLKLSV